MFVYDVTKTGLIKNVGANDFGKFFDNVTGVRFFNNDPNILCVSNADGFIHMYELRTFDRVFSFEGENLGVFWRKSGSKLGSFLF